MVRRKTIYEYDRVHFDKTDIRNWTSIYLKVLPTCLEYLDCHSCLTQSGSLEVSNVNFKLLHLCKELYYTIFENELQWAH